VQLTEHEITMNNNTSSTTSILTSLLGVALAAAIFFGIWQYRKSGSLFAKKTDTEATVDSLSNISNSLKSNVETLQRQLEEKNVAYETLQSQYEENNRLLSQKERTARNYRGEMNAFKAIDEEKAARLATLNQEIVELRTMKSNMEEQLKEIPVLTATVEGNKLKLKEWQDNYEKLDKRYAGLEEKYENIVYYSPADNFKVVALKANEQLTTKAKKSKTIQVSFKIPDYLKSDESANEPIYLSLTDSNMQLAQGVIDNVSVMSVQESMSLDIHATQKVDLSKSPQNIVFNLTLGEEVSPGNYTAKVYTANNYLGSVTFELRDSFWFF
jgi:chaperonin cofactor prefoldin